MSVFVFIQIACCFIALALEYDLKSVMVIPPVVFMFMVQDDLGYPGSLNYYLKFRINFSVM